ncbi:MAG TPA: hypothetical protein VHN39_05535 [Phenylobacterium sp.]|jgi:hypothetical protein|nr:hypothetical protein [Phenylobacterium sp.]
MTDDPMTATRGLLLPRGVVQPFFLLHRHDDLHIIGFFEGHPAYEAVEAMIQRRPAGAWSIRAILTRHDQSQIDHINEPALLASMRGARRETIYRPIDLALEDLGHARRARLAFESKDGEQVVLDLETAGAPSPRGGGLTDPGGHSADSSLPLMLRGASTLAGPRSRVRIDGVEYLLPVKARTEAFVGHEGYYTEDHAMGVVRAGEVRLRLLTSPDRPDVGARWTFETGDGRLDYVVTARAANGELRIEKDDGSGESLIAHAVGDQLDVTRIHVPSDPLGAGGVALSFGPAGRFSLSMDQAPDLVTGHTEATPSAEGVILNLRPAQPAWAAGRRVDVSCSRKGDKLSFITTIGAG